MESDGFFTITFARPVKEFKERMSVKDVGKKERIKRIFKKIKTKPPFTIISLAKEFGISDKTIERYIEEMKKDGNIKYVGSKRTGHYEIINLEGFS